MELLTEGQLPLKLAASGRVREIYKARRQQLHASQGVTR